METPLTDVQLDALREVANIGSGNAATALSSMLGAPVDLTVPSARALALADAVDAAGPAEKDVSAVLLPIFGDLEGLVLLVFEPDSATTLCGLLGAAGDPEMELSAIGEIGNILGASYVGAIGALTGLTLEPTPPQTLRDMLGAIVSTALTSGAAADDVALMLDSQLLVEGTECAFDFVFVPSRNGVSDVLARLGLGEAE